MRTNKLRLNPDKMEIFLVGQLSDPVAGISPVLDGVAAPLKVHVCSLGVLLNPQLLLGWSGCSVGQISILST